MKRYLKNNFIRAGLLLFLFGCGPLLTIILLSAIGLWPDPNPNPIGPGLLFFITIWPAIILLVIGVATAKPTGLGDEQTNEQELDKEPTVELSHEENAFISSSSLGAGFGLIYFMYLGVGAQFFRHLPANFYWPHTIANARRYAWEGRPWASFSEFKAKNSQIDSAAKWVLLIGLPVLVFLFVI